MNAAAGLDQALAGRLDKQACVQLLKEAVAIESVTGNEADFAEFLHRRLEMVGARSRIAEFAPGRPNVWAELAGGGTGPRLLFIGHTDTVHARGWRRKWAGTERENPYGGAVVDGEMWGRGTADLKAGICAALASINLIRECGVSLAGTVGFAFVGDEESGEPGSGRSAGIKDWSTRVITGEIPKPDFAIYTEPTDLAIFTAQMGFFIAEVSVTGKSAYFGVPEKGVDALKAANALLTAIWAHSEDIASAGEHELVGRSFALVTEIRCGGLIAVPGDCRFKLIRKLRPGESLEHAVAEFETVVNASAKDMHGISVQIEYPAGRDQKYGGSPAEIDPDLRSVSLLGQSLDAARPGAGMVKGAPYWSESTFLINEIDCPAVYCGPGDITNCHTLNERVSVSDYLACIIGFARFAASYCGTVGN